MSFGRLATKVEREGRRKLIEDEVFVLLVSCFWTGDFILIGFVGLIELVVVVVGVFELIDLLKKEALTSLIEKHSSRIRISGKVILILDWKILSYPQSKDEVTSNKLD